METPCRVSGSEVATQHTGLDGEAACARRSASTRTSTQRSRRARCRPARVQGARFRGWLGRLARFFLRDVPSKPVRVDVDAEFVALCRTVRFDELPVVQSVSASTFSPGNFDVISAYSGSPPLERRVAPWVQEFARILRPGGCSRSPPATRAFFDYCKWASDPARGHGPVHDGPGAIVPDYRGGRKKVPAWGDRHASYAE